jgi:hypothetical protein
MFKSSSCTTTVFPDGAIVMYDQPNNPTGYSDYGSGYYVKLNSDISTTEGQIVLYPTTGGSSPADTLDNVAKFRFIKKIGEQDTWDGVNNYVYCPAYGTVSSNGFTDATSTYDGRVLMTNTDDSTQDGGDDKEGIDWIQQTDTTHAYTTGGNEGFGFYTIDEDTDTYWQSYSTQAGSGTTSETLYSTHTFGKARDLTEVYFKAYVRAQTSSGASANQASASARVQYSTDNGSTWLDLDAGAGEGSPTSVISVSASGDQDSSDTIDTTITGITLTGVTDIRAKLYTYARQDGSGGGQSATTRVYELKGKGYEDTVAFKMTRAILGKMRNWNAALTSSETNGIWESPAFQVNAETLDQLFWNENKASGDDIILFMRTGATQAAVEDATSCVADFANNQIDAVGHGLENGDRVVIGYGTAPTGLSNTIMYYVVNKNVNDFQVSLTDGGAAVTFSDAGATVTFKQWLPDAGYTNTNGSNITNTANNWIQYCIVFTAADTTASNPQVYFIDGYVVKFNYRRGTTYAEDAVTWIYDIGFRNFDQPMVDKIFKKINVYYTESDDESPGSLVVYWKVDIAGTDSTGNRYDEYDPDLNGEKTFQIDLSLTPKRWDSFFPSIATGRQLSLRFYKSDQVSFILKEVKGLYTPEPVIV